MSGHTINYDPLYQRWAAMRRRCTNPKYAHYADYGGRGIGVCPEWRTFRSFEADMRPSFQKELWLDRIDNDLDYSFANCRWSTPAEQTRNKRNNVWLDTPWGRLCLSDTAKKLGINPAVLRYRLHTFSDPARIFRAKGVRA